MTGFETKQHQRYMAGKDHITPQDIASLLPGSKRSGDGYMCRCPAHEDKSPSLKVSPGHKATVLFCHAGCTVIDVLAKIGLRREQLFYDYRPGTGGGNDVRSDMLHVLAQMREKYRPPEIEKEYQLADIMWVALVSDRLDDEVWAEAMAQAGLEYPMMQLEYSEAMTMSVIVSDGPLFTFLRPLWETLGRPNWHTLKGQAMDKMHKVYVEKRRQS